ncbi:DUF11 domain-containing protein [Synechocystis sp. PCC 7509]|uniref:DUF11 domain-containing protein n=1 Tax=Synechocystis sp. PCC 7509 TaxID=927677 RepID=UPI0002ABC649|nr:DUF11 domain-containing protein [Synechocystis sp. PCC 7509]
MKTKQQLLHKYLLAPSQHLSHQRWLVGSLQRGKNNALKMGKGIQIVGLAAVLLGLSSPVQAAVIRNFTSRFSTNDTGDIQIVGNSSVTCSTTLGSAASSCTSALNGGTTGGLLNNNSYFMTNVDVDADSTTFNSSSANIVLPTGATVLWAGLYWGADSSAGAAQTTSPTVPAGSAAPNATQRNTVRLATPATGGYTTITATQLDADNSSGNDYQGFANVTSLIQAGGGGTYTVGNVQVGTGVDHQAGWSLVVVYRDTSQPTRNLTVFDGYAVVNTTTPNVSFTVSGFTTPPSGAVTAKIGAVAYEGDRGSTGDNLNFNGTTLTDAQNPTGNFFNSSISRTGSNLTNKNPNNVNQLGFDIDIISLSNPSNSVLGNNATSATINLTTSTTNGEFYQPGVITTAIDIFAPIVAGNINKSVSDLNGGTVLPGDILEYTVTVANTGQDGALNNVLTDPIPTNTTYLPGSLQITAGANTGAKTDTATDDQANYDSLNNRVVFRLGTGATGTAGGTLAPTNSTTIKFRVQVNAATPNSTILSNQATVAYRAQTLGTDFTAQSDGDSATSGVQPTNVIVTLPDMAIAKSHTGNFNKGQTGTYTLTATNLGPGTTNGTVTISDTLPTGLTPTAATGTGWTCTISGQVVTCTRSDALAATTSYPPITLTVNVAVNAPASITNTATVSGGGQANTTNDSVNDATTIDPLADLSLTKIVNNASPNIGDNVTFTVTLNNVGPDSATGVSVSDLLPAGLTFVSATPSQGTYVSNTGVWTVGTVGTAVNANSATLQIVATVATAGAKTNTAQVSASGQQDPDSTPNNNVATEDDQASVTVTSQNTDLSITKTDSPDPVIAGADLTYAIAVTNNGSATATNATMSDPLPIGTTFQSITTPPGWTCTTPAIGSNGTVSCTNPSFVVGSANFTVVVRVAPTTANNSSLSNTATISSTTSDPIAANNSSTQATTVQQSADLRLTKVSTPASPTVGGTFDYTITVTNDGSSTATNVQVTDQLPPTIQVAVTSVGITTTQGSTTYNATTPNVVWNVGTLAPNTSATLTIPATRLTADNTLNTAEVTFSDQSDPDSTPGNGQVGEDDRDSVTVPNQSVDLAVAKIVNNSTPNVGDSVIFTITVTNPITSPTAATNVGLSDILPPGLTYQSNTVSTGTYNSGTGVWSIASLNPGVTATLTITATVATPGAKTNTAQLSALDQNDPNSTNNSSSAIVTPNSVPPNLLLVKRITAVNGVDVTGFQDGVDSPTTDPNYVGTPKAVEDNDPLWPAPNTTSLRGAINSSTIAPTVSFKPGDEIEYTIYFLNNGASQATNVSICDFVPANQTFVSTGYDSSLLSADAGGLFGTNYGIVIQSANGAAPVKATNVSDSDRGQFYNSSFPIACNKGSTNGKGAVVVNIGTIPNATGAGAPANSYGFIRFKAKID